MPREGTDIRLFVCCHRADPVPAHELLTPIQVGAALAGERFPGFVQDDTGENISAKNRSYCELTAQYWAWKNVEADYYGFFHYRRYLYPDPGAKRPYRVEREPDGALLERLGYGHFRELIDANDVLLPLREEMEIPAREHYAAAPYHRREDLELAEELVRERDPELIPALESYLSGTALYFGNISIMRREIFRDYCGWLFPLLEEFDRRADWAGRNAQEWRVDGYLAERLLGVYMTARREELKILELPRAHFYGAEEYGRRKALNTLLPPGTKRRAAMKKLLK